MMRALIRAPLHFARCEGGLSAVEFALVAPLMITVYFGAFEMCDILLANRKITNVASATTDLVAQATQIADADIDNIFDAAVAIMEPYNTANLEITVSSVETDLDGNTQVAWSDALHATARAPGSGFSLPTGLAAPGGSVIVTEARYTYATPLGEFVTGGITMTDSFYQRPRRSMTIPRL